MTEGEDRKSSDLVEQVARMLWESDPGHTTDWQRAPKPHTDRCRTLARAAIALLGGHAAQVRTLADRWVAWSPDPSPIGPLHAAGMKAAMDGCARALRAIPLGPAGEAVKILLRAAYDAEQLIGEVSAWVANHGACGRDPEFERSVCTVQALDDQVNALAEARRALGGEAE